MSKIDREMPAFDLCRDAAVAAHQVEFFGIIEGGADPQALRVPWLFRFCLCVQDSPQNPCPCPWPPIFVWVLDDGATALPAERRSDDGRSVHRLRLPAGARVTVQAGVPVSAGALSAAVAETAGCGCDGAPAVTAEGLVRALVCPGAD